MPDGKVTERGNVAAKLPAFVPAKGPTVAPLIRTYRPPFVVHISPLFGNVGATPGVMLKPDFDVVDGSVVNGPPPVAGMVMNGWNVFVES